MSAPFDGAPQKAQIAEGVQTRPGPSPPNQPVPGDAEPTDLASPGLYINRELSWLEFNQRVLQQALDPRHPLLGARQVSFDRGDQSRRVLHGARRHAASKVPQ